MRKIISGRRASGLGESFNFKINTAITGSTGVGNFRVPVSNTSRFAMFGTSGWLVDWGDGNPLTSVTYSNYATSTLHTYTTPGLHNLKIYGSIESWSFRWMIGQWGDEEKMVEINQWGPFVIKYEGAFRNCSNLNLITCIDLPTTGPNAGLARLFEGCSSLEAINRIKDWDVSQTTNMSMMFYNNQKLQFGSWPSAGPIDLSLWDVSNVTTMSQMFSNTVQFDGKMFNVTSTTTNLVAMFMLALGYNNGNTGFTIENWDTSGATNMRSMFFGTASFNRDISGWDTTSVTNMQLMFGNNNNQASIFNAPIGLWNTSNVTDMSGMFYRNDFFDQDLSNWNVNAWVTPPNFTNIDGSGQGLPLTLSTVNYDALLIAWDAYSFPAWASGTVDFGDSQYTSGGAAAVARTSLIAKWGAITDGGSIAPPSDRRLKRNINKIGISKEGYNIYTFEFIDTAKYGSGLYQGVMSDNIPQEFVNIHADGYDRVDYSQLDVEFKKIK